MALQLETVAQHQPAAKETYCGSTMVNIDELKRLVSMDVKLTRMLLDGVIAVEQYDSVYSGYENRFESALGLKELLEARKEIGDTQEDSYLLKKRAIDWDMTRFQAGIERSQRCMRAIQQLPGHVDPGDVSEVEAFMRDSLGVVKNANLDGNTKKKLRKRIKRLAQLVCVA